MDSFRFYSSVPRVSMDGKPHEILALVACVSGFMVATVFLSIIIIVLRKVHRREWHKLETLSAQSDVEAQKSPEIIESTSSDQPKVKIFTIFGSKKQSFDLSS